MIPKIIHQTSKTAVISEKWLPFQEKVKAMHPDWEYRLWTDEDNRELVSKKFPDFLDIYDRLPKNIMRADVIRYLIMHSIGGMYLDLDYEFLKPFDLFDHDLVLPESRSISLGDAANCVGNCIFASKPGQNFWKIVIEDLTANPPLEADSDVESSTGPYYLTKIFNEKIRNTPFQNEIYMPNRLSFHPPIPRNQKEYEKIISAKQSYGIHHCHGTWRETTLLSRTKNLAKSLMRR